MPVSCVKTALVIVLFFLVIGCAPTESGLLPPSPSVTHSPPTMTVTSPPPTPTSLLPADIPSMTPTTHDRGIASADPGMLLISGGSFPMGSTDADIAAALSLCQEHYDICNRWFYERESPQHTVTLDDFWLDQTEVTNAQYRRCVEDGACLAPAACTKGDPTFADPARAGDPVVCVSWEEAQTFCEWRDARLPTEAEWEYAFRGEDGSIYPWGSAFDGTRLNYCDINCGQPHADERFNDGFSLSAPVGSFATGVSPSGILDLAGNVSEWEADWYGDFSPGAEVDPQGPANGTEKLLKGCSWFSHPAYCRGALRASVDPDTRFDYLGFRCAASEVPHSAGDPVMPPVSLDVPVGAPPTLDGTHADGEWDAAAVDAFADGSELRLLQADGFLYLGIQSVDPEVIAANIFIQVGDEIFILHSSAALGTAIYQAGEDEWQQTQDFTWQCRDTSFSEEAQAERQAFLQTEGWVAANGFMGTPNQLEYQIAIPATGFRLAAVIIKTSQPFDKIPWPPELDDDTVLHTPDGLPKVFQFSTERWVPFGLE